MLQHFLQNALLLLVLNIGVKGLYLLGIEREIQNVLPPGQYGLYFSLFNLSMLLQLVADFGLQLYNSRNLAGHEQLLRKYFPYFLGLKIALSCLFMLSLGLAAYLLAYDTSALYLLAILGVNQLLMSLLLFLRSNLTGTGRYRSDSWVSVVDKLMMLLLVSGLLFFARQQLNVYTFALAQSASWVVSILVVAALLRRQVSHWWPRYHRAQYASMLRRSFPFAVAIFLMTAYTRTDAVMIERLLVDGALQADHYAAAYRLLDAVNMLGYLLSGLLLPMFAQLFRKGESPLALLRLSLPTVVAGALIVCVPLALKAEAIVGALYDFSDTRTAQILSLLIFSFTAMCINYVYGALLGAANELRRMNYLFALGCAINLLGNLWALPRYGAAGAAAVTTLTQSFIALAQALLAHRQLTIPYSIYPWQSFLVFVGLLAVLNLFILPSLSLPLLPYLLIALTAGLAFAFLSRLLPWREWWRLLMEN